MASEEGVPASVVAEAVVAKARELVRALLKPGGAQGVEPSADAVAEEDKRLAACTARLNPDARLEDVDTLAVAAAVGALVGDVHLRGRSLNTPNNMMEEAVTYAVAGAAGFQAVAVTSLMASEEEAPAIIWEAVSARSRELVRALLKPSGSQSIEPSADAAANKEKRFVACMAWANPAVRREDVDMQPSRLPRTSSSSPFTNVGDPSTHPTACWRRRSSMHLKGLLVSSLEPGLPLRPTALLSHT